jgi:Activator of Hsp90 ATPase homolog 1-like protein
MIRETKIETGEDFAKAVMVYNGEPVSGMLAFLDVGKVKTWWKAVDGTIEPYQGGMFYLAWGVLNSGAEHAIFGIVKKIDTDQNVIEVDKILYTSPLGKMENIFLRISFTAINDTQTEMILTHRHSFKGVMKKIYDDTIALIGPKTCSLLKNYLEKESANSVPSK